MEVIKQTTTRSNDHIPMLQMKNQEMEYSNLEAEDPISAFKFFMKENFKMYTKQFAKVFDNGNSGISREVSKSNIENPKNSNVDHNIISSTSFLTDNSLPLENEKITKTHLLKTGPQTKNNPSDKTYVNISTINPKDSSNSDGSDQGTVKGYMAAMEKFLQDFDKTNTLLNTPRRKDEPNSFSKLKTLSPTYEIYIDKKNKTESPMSCDDETIKLQSTKISDENGARKQNLACILSDNYLLKKEVEQLRIKFKRFFLEFNTKTGTFKTTKYHQNHSQLSSKSLNTADNPRENRIKDRTFKMTDLDSIERPKKKNSRSIRPSESNQRLESSSGHFNRDGLCIRSNGRPSLPLNKDSVSRLRRKNRNFYRVFSKTHQVAKNFLLFPKHICSSLLAPEDSQDRRDVVEERNSSTLQISEVEDDNFQEIFNIASEDSKDRSDVVEERNLSTLKISKEENNNFQEIFSKTDQPTFESNLTPLMTETYNHPDSPSTEIYVSCCDMEDPGLYTTGESRISHAINVTPTPPQPPTEKTKQNMSGKSPDPIITPNLQTNLINEYCGEIDVPSGSLDISVKSSMSKTPEEGNLPLPDPELNQKDLIILAEEINQAIDDPNTSTNETNEYCGEICRRYGGLNVSIRSNNSATSSRGHLLLLDEAVEESNSSDALQITASGDCLEINNSNERAISQTHVQPDQIIGDFQAVEKVTSSRDPKEIDELGYDIDCCLEESDNNLSDRKNVTGSSQNYQIAEGQKISNMHSLPVGNDGLIIDPSLSVSLKICNNLQSTCMYFDENKTVTELVAVLLQRDSDMDDVLEKLGGYDDFEKPLLFNSRLTSETNQTV